MTTLKGFLAVSYESKPSQAAGNGALLLRLDAAAAPRSGGVDDAAGGGYGWMDPWPILPGSRGSTPSFFGSKNGGLNLLVDDFFTPH